MQNNTKAIISRREQLIEDKGCPGLWKGYAVKGMSDFLPDGNDSSKSRQKLAEAQIRDRSILTFDFESVLTNNASSNEKTLADFHNTVLETQMWRQRNQQELAQQMQDVCKEEGEEYVNGTNKNIVEEAPESQEYTELYTSRSDADETYQRLHNLINNVQISQPQTDTRQSLSTTTTTTNSKHTYDMSSEEALRRDLTDQEMLSIQQNVRDEGFAKRILDESNMITSNNAIESRYKFRI